MENTIAFLTRVRELNSSIQIRRAILSDGQAFVRLFNNYYKRKTCIEYFKWQFFDSPFDSMLAMAFDGEALIGFYGIKKYPLSTGIYSGFAIDFFIADTYRKRGIAFLLESEVVRFCQENDIKLLTALPNFYGNAAFKTLGWSSVAKIDTLVCNDFNLLFHNSKEAIEIVEIEAYVRFAKDEIYRTWRFNDNPLYNYKKIHVDKNHFAMVKLFKNPETSHSVGDIVELVCPNLKVLSVLINEVVAFFKEENVNTMTIWALPHTVLYSFLVENGLKIEEQQRFFCVKAIDLSQRSLTDIKMWNLDECDAEIY